MKLSEWRQMIPWLRQTSVHVDIKKHVMKSISIESPQSSIKKEQPFFTDQFPLLP